MESSYLLYLISMLFVSPLFYKIAPEDSTGKDVPSQSSLQPHHRPLQPLQRAGPPYRTQQAKLFYHSYPSWSPSRILLNALYCMTVFSKQISGSWIQTSQAFGISLQIVSAWTSQPTYKGQWASMAKAQSYYSKDFPSITPQGLTAQWHVVLLHLYHAVFHRLLQKGTNVLKPGTKAGDKMALLSPSSPRRQADLPWCCALCF